MVIKNNIIAEVITDTHVYFWGGIFSQWYTSSNQIFKDGIYFDNAEQFMMYQKAQLFEDYATAKKILENSNPRTAKKLGRKVKNFNENIWVQHREKIVEEGNILKFSQNKYLKNELLKLKDKTFVEASPYDKIWGIGLSYDNPLIYNEENWKGLNLLGKIITEVANKIK